MEWSFNWRKYRFVIGFRKRVVTTPAVTGKQASSGNESFGIREKAICFEPGDNCMGAEGGRHSELLSDRALKTDYGVRRMTGESSASPGSGDGPTGAQPGDRIFEQENELAVGKCCHRENEGADGRCCPRQNERAAGWRCHEEYERAAGNRCRAKNEPVRRIPFYPDDGQPGNIRQGPEDKPASGAPYEMEGETENVQAGNRPGKAVDGDGDVDERSGRAPCGQRPEEYLFQLTLTAVGEIKPGIRAAAQKKLGRAELLLTLRRMLKHYAALTASRALPFRVAINNVILSETAAYCSIHLDNEELNVVWRSPG